MPTVRILPENRILTVPYGESVQTALAGEGLISAPCGGAGTCGKCRVLVDGVPALACKTRVTGDITVSLPTPEESDHPESRQPGRAAAFDIGTTTLVCYLLSQTGAVLGELSAPNPQQGYGADVISRIQASKVHGQDMTRLIRSAMTQLLLALCSTPKDITDIGVVGNPAMQQLFLGLPLENLGKIPFAPVLTRPEILPCGEILPAFPNARILTVPDIAGFVGADTVAGILSSGLHTREEMTLLVDIGTNGEMVLGSRHGMTACSTAAGPALEGAGIRFGMRAAPGAIDHVWLEGGRLCCSVIGGGPPKGICGSGLIDAVAAALNAGLLNRRGRILNENRTIPLMGEIFLTQEDIRQVMLAKGAIHAGIRLMAREMGITLGDISQVLLAGAFGSVLNPESACRIGLLPGEFRGRVRALGNAAGAGGVLLAANPALLSVTGEILTMTQALELSALPEFSGTFARSMELPEDILACAKAAGFTEAALFDPACLEARADVREMCAADRCGAYGKNWTCPPHCGTLEDCRKALGSYRRGILLQTVGQLRKTIDSRGYREAERQHLESFTAFCQAVRRLYPNALCLGAGGCRICRQCAYPQPCRFPEKAVSSMEAYGLFVTQVCRDGGLAYHHGEKTVTYTACVLY